MEAIGSCRDDNLRTVLILVHAGFEELGNKIDAMWDDEKAIQDMALNGVSEGHAQDHIDWRAFKATRPDGKCPYVVKMAAQEEEVRRDRHLIGRDLTAKIMWFVLGILALVFWNGIKHTLGL